MEMKWSWVQISVVVAIIQMSYRLFCRVEVILLFNNSLQSVLNFEGRSGIGFFAIGDHAKVSRS